MTAMTLPTCRGCKLQSLLSRTRNGDTDVARLRTLLLSSKFASEREWLRIGRFAAFIVKRVEEIDGRQHVVLKVEESLVFYCEI